MAGVVMVSTGCRGGESGGRRERGEEEQEQQDSQLSLIALLLAAIRRSVVACRVDPQKDAISAVRQMEIGWPTNVRHVTHVTFDCFNGFLGLPVEFEVEIPCQVPSASASVFGVSPESMQCCYDAKGNSVPTILLLMQERLYAQGGLKAEGIFRINPENSQEEIVRKQLNKGIVPDDIDVHCLAGLIKAWFRELPEGVLDGLSPEQVLRCNTEEECVELVKLLLPTQAALLNWSVDLMADVVEEEDLNKMNARNIAMVFAPNMTQMSDPLTALMHAVQVMNFLKTLILRTLREREEASLDGYSPFSRSPWSDEHSDGDLDSRRGVCMSGELGQVSEYDHDEYCQDDVDVSGELMADDHHVSSDLDATSATCMSGSEQGGAPQEQVMRTGEQLAPGEELASPQGMHVPTPGAHQSRSSGGELMADDHHVSSDLDATSATSMSGSEQGGAQEQVMTTTGEQLASPQGMHFPTARAHQSRLRAALTKFSSGPRAKNA